MRYYHETPQYFFLRNTTVYIHSEDDYSPYLLGDQNGYTDDGSFMTIEYYRERYEDVFGKLSNANLKAKEHNYKEIPCRNW